MYQELQIYEEFVDGFLPVWGTEGNDLPLPAFAVGDVFDPAGLPNIPWRNPPKLGQCFKVVAIRHAFTETGPGPEANYILQVAVALDGLGYEQRLERDLEEQKRRGNQYKALVDRWAKKLAPEIQEQVIEAIVSTLKNTPAYGIGSDDESAWHEAACIARADAHGLHEVMHSDIRSRIDTALNELAKDDQITLWLSVINLDEWFEDGWPDGKYFELPARWRQATIEHEDELAARLVNLLHQHAVDS